MRKERLFQIIPVGPEGFSYQPDFITVEEEEMLLDEFSQASLHTYTYKGYESKRRIKSFTKETGFSASIALILERIANFVYIPVEMIEHALITEYAPGTAIGWHCDQPPYDKIVGISLGSYATLRLRRYNGMWKNNKRIDKDKWERFNIQTEPRSLYVMSDTSRKWWQHSVAKVTDWWYSLTVKTIEKTIKF